MEIATQAMEIQNSWNVKGTYVKPFHVSRILYFHCLSGYLYSFQQKY